MPDDEMYLIWSNEHKAWWRGGKVGYTKQLKDAGVYKRIEAIAICRNAIPGTAGRLGMFPEIPVRLADYEDMVFRMKMPDDLKRG